MAAQSDQLLLAICCSREEMFTASSAATVTTMPHAVVIMQHDDDEEIENPVRTLKTATWQHTGPKNRHLRSGVLRFGIDAKQRHCVAFTSNVDPTAPIESGWHGTWKIVSDYSIEVIFRYKGCHDGPVLIRHVFTNQGWRRQQNLDRDELMAGIAMKGDRDYVLTWKSVLRAELEDRVVETELPTDARQVTLIEKWAPL